MRFLIYAALVIAVLSVWCPLVVASDADDKMGYDDILELGEVK